MLRTVSVAIWSLLELATQAVVLYHEPYPEVFRGLLGFSSISPSCLTDQITDKVLCLVGTDQRSLYLVADISVRPGGVRSAGPSSTSISYGSRGFTLGHHPSPFCADLNEDGRVDCLVGDANGHTTLLETSLFSSGAFERRGVLFDDLGSDAKPFCGADLDADGITDCLVGLASGHVALWHRTSRKSLSFTLASQSFFGRSLGSNAAPFCGDLDGDGEPDCLVGRADGYVSLLQRRASDGQWIEESSNIFGRAVNGAAAPFCLDFNGDGSIDCVVAGNNDVAFFSPVVGPSFAFNGVVAQAGDHAMPACLDVDLDGVMDCLVGVKGGQVEHFRRYDGFFQNYSSSFFGTAIASGHAAPTCFTLSGSVECLLGSKDGKIYRPNGTEVHTLRSPPLDTFAVPSCSDLDGDGDVDCVVGYNSGIVRTFEWRENAWHWAQSSDFNVETGFAAPACFDLDGDGQMECLVASSHSVHLYRNTGESPVFNWTHMTSNFFHFAALSARGFSCVDLDSDGFLDCLGSTISGQVFHVRQNDRRGPAFIRESRPIFDDISRTARPSCTDLDGNGFVECMVGLSDGTVAYFGVTSLQAPGSTLSIQQSNFFFHVVGNNAATTCFDMDGDGDKDCLVGWSNSPGTCVYSFEKTGSGWQRSDCALPLSGVPFCADFDDDGDTDCLVGTQNGTVHFFTYNGGSWTRFDDIFDYDVGDDAVPFCQDWSGDGHMDCFVGNRAGVVINFRNVGTPQDHQWVRISQDVLNFDVGRMAAPSCLDLDGDGDMDCLVGSDSGHIYVFKNHLRSLSRPGHRGVYCPVGSFRDAVGGCKLCVAGRYDAGTSTGPSTCALCHPGTQSDAGWDRCLATVEHWLGEWRGTTTLSINKDLGSLILQWQTLPLPRSGAGFGAQLFGNVSLAYGFDLQPALETLASNSSCGADVSWKLNGPLASLEYRYGDREACRLDTVIQAGAVTLTGYAALFVILEETSGATARRVLDKIVIPLEVRLLQQVVQESLVKILPAVAAPWHPHQILAFSSHLQLSQRQWSKTQSHKALVVSGGQKIYLLQDIIEAEAVAASTIWWVWISTSLDPFDVAATVANLTGQLQECEARGAAASCAFIVPNKLEKDAVLHTISFLGSTGSAAVFSHGSLLFPVIVPTSYDTRTLTGSFSLLIMNTADANRFVADAGAQRAVAAALRELAGIQLPRQGQVAVDLVLDGNSRRLRHSRRLAAATVQVHYTFVLPTATLDSVAGQLEAATKEEAARVLKATLEAERPGIYEVSVASWVPVASSTTVGLTSVTIFTEPGLDGWVPFVITGVVVVFVFVAIFLCWKFNPRCRRCAMSSCSRAPAPPPAPIRVPTPTPSPRPPIAASPRGTKKLSPVGSEVLAYLQKLFDPPTETRDSMGIGRDVREARPAYTALKVQHAWAITSPGIGVYDGWKEEVCEQIPQGGFEAVETLTDEVSAFFGMDSELNEKLLLHGTKAKNVLRILALGLTDKFAKGKLFGQGIYFAEDPSKSDQYTGGGDATDLQQLHKTLYTDQGLEDPGEVYYTFVCQVVLGAALRAKYEGERLLSIRDSLPVFVDTDTRNLLINIPGTEVPYHSLVAEMSPKNQRHREFVLFYEKGVLLKFLVAYTRRKP